MVRQEDPETHKPDRLTEFRSSSFRERAYYLKAKVEGQEEGLVGIGARCAALAI